LSGEGEPSQLLSFFRLVNALFTSNSLTSAGLKRETDLPLTTLEILTLCGLVASGFVATSMDNLLILVILLGANAKRRSAVLLGSLVSSIAVICVSILGVALGSMVGSELIGYLGVVPLLMGCYLLYKIWRGGVQEKNLSDLPAQSSDHGIWWTTFILMFSNSGDSIAVFLPLLAESGRESLLFIVGVYLLMALLWAGMSYLISGQAALARRIEKGGEKLVPFIMIAVGLYILSDSATDTLL
jgi:cadmium resistance protein CadD (predicted permease)